MTTEIAVVNRLGVALATDSAVTISGGGKSKVFDTGDKLFELSDQYPVGVMINGNMDLLGVPWEIIIKDFRAFGQPRAGDIESWLRQLLEFTAAHKCCDEFAERQHVVQIALTLFDELKDVVYEHLIANQGAEPAAILTAEVAARMETCKKSGRAPTISAVKMSDVIRAYRDELSKLIDESFPVAINRPLKTAMIRLVAIFLISNRQSEFSTVLIVAGYGDGNMFPSLAIAEVDGTVNRRLKWIAGEHVTVSRSKNPGRVISFAQTDVVERLLSGADNRFVSRSADYFESALQGVQGALVGAFTPPGTDPAENNRIFQEVIAAVSDEYRSKFAPTALAGFKREFNEMVALMPKQDIIELAEALVSITAIERKASSAQATVGGPVDVAFITRHEGFVWIKRKHYFDPTLNPRFFWRKYGNRDKKERPHESDADPERPTRADL